jgi:hypothetical protein
MEINPQRHKVLTLLSALRGKHRGDNRSLLAETAAIAARMDENQSRETLEQLVHELEGAAER